MSSSSKYQSDFPLLPTYANLDLVKGSAPFNSGDGVEMIVARDSSEITVRGSVIL